MAHRTGAVTPVARSAACPHTPNVRSCHERTFAVSCGRAAHVRRPRHAAVSTSRSACSTSRPPAARRTTCGITEIGAVKVRGGEFLGTFQTLVNPGRAIPPEITVLTGITAGDGAARAAHRVRARRRSSSSSAARSSSATTSASTLASSTPRWSASGCPGSPTHRSTPAPWPAGWCATRCPTAGSARWRAASGSTTSPATAPSTTRWPPPTCCTCCSSGPAAFGVLGPRRPARAPPPRRPPAGGQAAAHHRRCPRTPGVYLFVDRPGRGALRRARPPTCASGCARTSPATTAARSASCCARRRRSTTIACATTLEAAVTEVRLIHEHRAPLQPPGQALALATPTSSSRSTSPSPASSVVRAAARRRRRSTSGRCRRPASARLVAEAIETVVPLRRCTARLRPGRPPSRDGAVRAGPAGVATCPCAARSTPPPTAGRGRPCGARPHAPTRPAPRPAGRSDGRPGRGRAVRGGRRRPRSRRGAGAGPRPPAPRSTPAPGRRRRRRRSGEGGGAEVHNGVLVRTWAAEPPARCRSRIGPEPPAAGRAAAPAPWPTRSAASQAGSTPKRPASGWSTATAAWPRASTRCRRSGPAPVRLGRAQR